jgi:hypothetical protein
MESTVTLIKKIIMAFVFALIGLFVQIIFMFKREWLFEKKSFTVIFIVSVVLFVLSYILMLNHIGDPKVVRMLTIPLLAAIIFYIVKQIFFKLYDRNLEDTFWSMDWGQMSDGVFNAVFWFSSTVLSVLFTYFVLP